MPHIVVTVIEGTPYMLKKTLAKEIAYAAATSFGLPPEMVTREVTFADVPFENCAPAVDITGKNPPIAVRYIAIDILAGRPLEDKRKAVKAITEVVAKNLGISAESEEIVVEIREVNPANISHGGVLSLDMKNPPLPVK
jgi:phenylpyruvate tautomerase PptA (4-oxalocrotonate tautomerase family)